MEERDFGIVAHTLVTDIENFFPFSEKNFCSCIANREIEGRNPIRFQSSVVMLQYRKKMVAEPGKYTQTYLHNGDPFFMLSVVATLFTMFENSLKSLI